MNDPLVHREHGFPANFVLYVNGRERDTEMEDEWAQDLAFVEPCTGTMLWVYTVATLCIPLAVLVATLGPTRTCGTREVLEWLEAADSTERISWPAATTPRVLMASLAVVPAWAAESFGWVCTGTAAVFPRFRAWLWFMGFVMGTWLLAILLLVDTSGCDGVCVATGKDVWGCRDTWALVPAMVYGDAFSWATTATQGKLGFALFVLAHVVLCLESAWNVGTAAFVWLKALKRREDLWECSDEALLTVGMGLMAVPEVVARLVWLPGCFVLLGSAWRIVVSVLTLTAAGCGVASKMGTPLK